MLGPGWEEGCKSCSYLADHFDGANIHLPHRDVTFIAVSRSAAARRSRLIRKRMGWRFKWVSLERERFQLPDYHVSFTPEEEKKNEVYYNYQKQEFMLRRAAGVERRFTGTKRAPSTTPIQPTRAGSMAWLAPISFSIWCRKVGTKIRSQPWIGCGGTTNTRPNEKRKMTTKTEATVVIERTLNAPIDRV